MDAIRIEGLTKKYKDVTAVNELSLTINQGEIFSLLGVNGAGKTTLIKMLSCITTPTSGDAYLMGKSICREASEVKSVIAVSPQETAVAMGLSVRENLELICGVYELSRDEANNRIKNIVDLLDLNEVLCKKAGKLSGGWQRRLSIAMALVSDPQILFLDEPSLGLDVIIRSELWDIIRALKGRVTVILTTHYMEEAEALSDRIAIMSKGSIVVCDTADEIKKMANTESFEDAFIKVVRGDVK